MNICAHLLSALTAAQPEHTISSHKVATQFPQVSDSVGQGRPTMPWQKIGYALVGRLLYLE
jgi:hypothetical protein